MARNLCDCEPYRILLMLALTRTRDPAELQKIFETY